MFEDLLFMSLTLKTISYRLKGNSFVNKVSSGNNSTVEGLKIIPSYPLLKLFINNVIRPLKPALKKFNENISFLDIGEDNEFVYYCDWCSLANGILYTAKENIISDITLLDKIDFNKLNIFKLYLDWVLIQRTNKVSNEDIINFSRNNFGEINNSKLNTLSEIYLKLELIELRWCPFKRSKESYYKNKDKRFLFPDEEIIQEVGKILKENETVTCNNCPDIVNKNWKYTKSNNKSHFQPVLEYLLLII